MNSLNYRVNTVLIAALMLLGLGAFLAVATDFGKNWDNHHDSDSVAAINTTTSRVTFREPPPTTTTFAVATTLPVATTVATTPPTTAKKTTTATTKKPTTATTRRPSPTTTVPPPPHNGAGQEASDRSGSFTHSADDTYTNTTPNTDCAASDPFCFKLSSASSNNAHPHEVNVIAVFKNHTTRTVSFPGGLKLTVNLHNPDGTITQFAMDAETVTSLSPGETVQVSTWTSFIPTGEFTFDATCEVDYGS